MGEVLRARIETVGGVRRPVALKLVRKDLAGQPSFARLFVEEMKVAMALSHANVVQAFDVGTVDGRWFLAMEYVEGLDLAALLARRQRGRALPLGVALYIAVEALQGLDYAHRRTGEDGCPLAIVHRDVSPGNLLLSREGEVKVADFGVAKSTLRDVGSVVGRLKGKIPYMPPEQVRGDPVDARADLYAVAAVLYEMVAGRRLVGGDGAAAIPRVLEGPDRALASVRGAVPRGLHAILAKALSLDPRRRHATAGQVRRELEALAVEQRVLLSSAELAAEVADAVHARDPGADVPTLVDGEPGAGAAFDERLGQALAALASDEPYSVYRTVVEETDP